MEDYQVKPKRKYKARPKRAFMLRIRLSDKERNRLVELCGGKNKMSKWVRKQINRRQQHEEEVEAKRSIADIAADMKRLERELQTMGEQFTCNL